VLVHPPRSVESDVAQIDIAKRSRAHPVAALENQPLEPAGDLPWRPPPLHTLARRHGSQAYPRLLSSPAVTRLRVTNLRAAWWAIRTARRTRRLLEAEGLDAALSPPPPPKLPARAERGVKGALRRWNESCLVNAIVLQAWEAAHGRRRDLLVGITGPGDFSAHAWLEGDHVPPADDPGIGRSLLGGIRDADRDGGEMKTVTVNAHRTGPMRPFNELVRRPAPDYGRAGAN
jgi:hypothetical protein